MIIIRVVGNQLIALFLFLLDLTETTSLQLVKHDKPLIEGSRLNLIASSNVPELQAIERLERSINLVAGEVAYIREQSKCGCCLDPASVRQVS